VKPSTTFSNFMDDPSDISGTDLNLNRSSSPTPKDPTEIHYSSILKKRY